MVLNVLGKIQNYIHIFIYTVDEKCQANQRGCHLSDSKCFDLNFINLNDKKIYDKLPHMSGCLIQTFRPLGLFSVLQNQNLSTGTFDFVNTLKKRKGQNICI